VNLAGSSAVVSWRVATEMRRRNVAEYVKPGERS